MTDDKIRAGKLGALFCLFAAAILLTCDKVPEYCGKGTGKNSWLHDGQFCFGDAAHNLCDGKDYNPLTEGCVNGAEIGVICRDSTLVQKGTPCGGYTLTTDVFPTGAGKITRIPDETRYSAGQKVFVGAEPAAETGYTFVGWAGTEMPETATPTVTMNGNKTMVAVFNAIDTSRKLITTAIPKEGGDIKRNPDKNTYGLNETVTVTATPNKGYTFKGWSGASNAGSPAVQIKMDESKTLAAVFTPSTCTLTVNANPVEGGAVFINNTAATGAAPVDFGATIEVRAVAANGYGFTGWAGAAASTNSVVMITMDGDKALTANFKKGAVTPTSGTDTIGGTGKSVVDPNTVIKGTFTDSRNGQTYKTVKIGSQTWMAENLNYETGNSWCYSNNNSNCEIYGRLYDWNTAMKVCPSGWHLPSRQEWGDLAIAAGGTGTYGTGGTAGTKLKSKSGWNDYQGKSGNGTDYYGFSALPGGRRNSGGGFVSAGNYGDWRTATEYSSDLAYSRDMGYSNDGVYEYGLYKSDGQSVRCVQD